MKVTRRQLRAMIQEQADIKDMTADIEDMTFTVTKADMDKAKQDMASVVDLKKLEKYSANPDDAMHRLFARVFTEILNKRQRTQLVDLVIEEFRKMGVKEAALVQGRAMFIRQLLDAYSK